MQKWTQTLKWHCKYIQHVIIFTPDIKRPESVALLYHTFFFIGCFKNDPYFNEMIIN